MATLTGPLNKSANTSGTTLVAKATTDTTYSAAVGDMLVLAFACNLNTATVTVADSAGNTWVLEDTATAAANNQLKVFTCRVTVALPTNGTVTVTCSSVSRRCSQLYKISAAGGFLARDCVIHATSTTTALSLQSYGSVGEADEYAFKFDGMTPAGAASGRTDTTLGWTDKGTVDSGGTVVSVSLGSSFLAATNRSASQFANTATQTAAVARASIGLSIRGISAPTDTLVQTFSPVGQSLATMTATPLKTPVTGNTLIAVVATNENGGADDINCPAGWVPMDVIRNTAGTHVRLKVYGIHVADWIAAGSPAMTWTTTAAFRIQVAVGEFSGEYNLTPEARGTNQGTTGTTGTTGSVTPLGTGRLVIMAFAEKNSQPITDATATPPTWAAFTVTNEDQSTLSSNKISVWVGYVDNRGASATSASTSWPTTNAPFAGISLSLQTASETAPTAPVLDNFNTGASQNLDGRTGWGVAGRVIAGDFSMKTDATPTVAGVSLGTPASNLWATGMGADHEVYATLGTADTFYLVARGNTATGNLAAGYLAVIGWTGQIDIRTYNGTVLYTSTAGNFLAAPAAGDSYCFQAVGSKLTLWRRKSGGSWQVVVTITDSTYTTGTFVGMKAESGSAVTITDFGAVTLVAGGPATITPAAGGVSFGGTGSLTAATSVAPASAGVSFGGTGSITSIPRVSGSASVTFSGTGAITSIPGVSGTSGVSFSGAGDIAAPTRMVPTSQGKVQFNFASGGGSITAPTGITPAAAGVSFGGSGSVTVPGAAAIIPASADVTFGGSGSVTSSSAAPVVPASAGVSFSGAGSLTAAAQVAFSSTGVSFAGTGSTTAPTRLTIATSGVSFAATGSITVTPRITPATGGVTFSGSGALTTAASVIPATGGVSFSGTAALTTAAQIVPSGGSVTFSGSAQLAAPALITFAASGVFFNATGLVTATGPGGGGFGAEMGGGFLNRYAPGYRGQYRGGYRSLMRKVKG